MVHLAREPVRRKPFGHRIRVDERPIDRIPAEAIGTRLDDHGRWLSGGYGCAGCAEFGNRVREQRYGNHDKERAQRRSQRSRKEREWRGEMYQRPCDERGQIDERWANETEIGNILPYIRETRALRPGYHGFRSFRSIRLTEPSPSARK